MLGTKGIAIDPWAVLGAPWPFGGLNGIETSPWAVLEVP